MIRWLAERERECVCVTREKIERDREFVCVTREKRAEGELVQNQSILCV